MQIIIKTDCQGYDIKLFSSLDIHYLKKIHIYFLECKNIENNRINFYKNVKLFDKILM